MGSMEWVYALRDVMGYLRRVILVLFSPTAADERIYEFSKSIQIVELPQHVGSRRLSRVVSFGLGAWRFIVRSVELTRRERIQAILALDPHFLGLVAYGLSRLFRKPWMIEIVQNYDVSSRQAHRMAFKPFLFPWIERCVERWLLQRADLVLCMYPALARWVVGRGVAPSRVIMIGTVTHECHYRERLSDESDRSSVLPNESGRHWLLYVGRLHPVKFTHDLPKILRATVNAGVDAHLIILGDGPQRDQLIQEFERQRVSERVSVLGTQSQETLAQWYRLVDVIVYTHGGIALVEGALSGTPLVCYRHDWHADLIGEDERGYLVRFRDTRAFGETIAKVILDPGEASVRTVRAQDYARREFSYERYELVQRRVYETLAALSDGTAQGEV